MIHEISERFIASVLQNSYGNISRSAGTSDPLADLTTHGTTVGAFLIEGGSAAIVFSDGKVSRGDTKSVIALDFCKIFSVDRFSCVLVAGALGAAVDLVDRLRTIIGFTQDANNVTLPTEVKANFIRKLQQQNIPLASQGMEVWLLFVTFDTAGSRTARIFQVSSDGSQLERPAADSLGSGSNSAIPRLEDGWKPNMTQQEGIELVRNIKSKSTDNFSGGTWVLWRINKKGIKEIERWPHERV